ncbi:MAG: hypothetical protein ACYTHM_18845 [Planctomycetota bacterium]|jgi:hypothetical protein
MTETRKDEPLIERLKMFRPRRRVRRGIVQAVCILLTMVLLAECIGAVLKLAGCPWPLS